jgi:5-methylcytosine-specific restriction protein A
MVLMPIRPKRSCNFPGCTELVDKGYCDKHKKDNRKVYDKEYDRTRGTSTQRGYGANHRKLRKIVLDEEPLCRHCKAKGIIKPSKEMDHIDGDQFNLARDNLQGLCKSCHSKKTVRKQSALQRGRG